MTSLCGLPTCCLMCQGWPRASNSSLSGEDVCVCVGVRGHMLACMWVSGTWNEHEGPQNHHLPIFSARGEGRETEHFGTNTFFWLCRGLEAGGQARCMDISDEKKKVEVSTMGVYLFARAGPLKQQKRTVSRLRRPEVRDEKLAGSCRGPEGHSVSCLSLHSEGALAASGVPWLVDASPRPFFACIFTWRSLRVHVCLCVRIFPSYKDTVMLDQGPPLMTSS